MVLLGEEVELLFVLRSADEVVHVLCEQLSLPFWKDEYLAAYEDAAGVRRSK